MGIGFWILDPASQTFGKLRGNRVPPGETGGTGDPTDLSCSHTRDPEPESRLSPDHPPRSQRTTWGDAGPRMQSCPQRLRNQRRRAVTVQGARGPAAGPAPTRRAGGNRSPSGTPGRGGVQGRTPDFTAGKPGLRHSRLLPARLPRLPTSEQHTHHF